MDPEIKALITVLIEGQIHTDKSLSSLIEKVDRYVEASDVRMPRMHSNGGKGK